MAEQESDKPSREQRLAVQARFFENPWNEATQKVRNQLLLVSILGILMAAAGILPKEITALGLKLQDINQRALLITWAAVDAYLTITFFFYSYSDFMHGYWPELFKLEITELPRNDWARELALKMGRLQGRLQTVHVSRLLLDALIPLLSGITAFGWLVWRSTTV